jgi:CubicO group peptidase (beta-lactamase class C family)
VDSHWRAFSSFHTSSCDSRLDRIARARRSYLQIRDGVGRHFSSLDHEIDPLAGITAADSYDSSDAVDSFAAGAEQSPNRVQCPPGVPAGGTDRRGTRLAHSVSRLQASSCRQHEEEIMAVATVARTSVAGYVSPGFEAVRDAFADNFTRRGELGGACCVYRDGLKVVDIWGGVRNGVTGEPWQERTMVIVHSSTKGLAAMTLGLAHSRGWLDYEERVAHYWPEFAQQRKERVTVRQLLAHQAGLFVLDQAIDRGLVADPDRLAVVLARQKPAWEPGTRQAYHAITLGFYEGELLRRIDPQHRTLGQFFHDEIAAPLGLDTYIRLPEEIADSRLATITRPGPIDLLLGFPLRFALDAFNPRSKIARALRGSELPHDARRIYARNLEIPSGGAVTTARGLAHAYGVFAAGGGELGLRRDTLDLLAAPAVPPARGFRDECLKGEVQFSLGFMKPTVVWPFGGASSYGSPGSGGSLGFADPVSGIGYGYVTNRMGTALTGDPRDGALRNALETAIRSS